MSLRTKKEIVDEIRYEVYGGMPSVDAAISENFILRKLNNKIATSAMQQALGSYKMDGAVCVDDIFTLTYSDLTLTVDGVTGLKYFEIPSQPIGLPDNQSITVFPPKNRGGMMSDLFKKTTRKKWTMVRSLPSLKKVFHITENGREYFNDEFGIMQSYDSVNASIVTSGAQDLSAFLNLPDDMISQVKAECIAELRPMMGLADLTPIPAVDNPQPRE